MRETIPDLSKDWLCLKVKRGPCPCVPSPTLYNCINLAQFMVQIAHNIIVDLPAVPFTQQGLRNQGVPRVFVTVGAYVERPCIDSTESAFKANTAPGSGDFIDNWIWENALSVIYNRDTFIVLKRSKHDLATFHISILSTTNTFVEKKTHTFAT